ncbi:DNA N-6-adenine-methyltransferase [Acidithiobacillus caldus]|jgi:ParB family chromosome partitioning protein|nr:DNA N-6-adenine-methyltransferase [Acidithiobacillus caldus]MBU2763714.1 ParB N-terminal domain-containing protein [Acidithiobacillus caldus]MBU2771890.1 ParB N-terminal domain-containing protein [Acidithiobacillus caldus]MBU2783705.1 ParB N-terminal domain-containing protein [Acidithiobacillus caldus]OFC35781.1 hypothetical protein BAE28_10040 [Acidithiobacillus caldus]OFC41541.1 hypothetical protein BAE29_02320 [Acidithiobacillus caldus]
MNTQPQTGVVQAAISDISVGRRFRQDLGDIGALAQSIQKFGLLQPIGVDEQYRLIFGQRRLAACRLLGWETVPVKILHIDSLIEGEFEENSIRKDFSVSERVAIAKAIEEQLAGRHGGDRRSKDFQDGKISGLKEGGESRDLVADRSGFGCGKTYESARNAVEQGIPDLVEILDDGLVSIHTAARIADLDEQEQEEVVEAIQAGEKPTDALRAVADPAWSDEWYTPDYILDAARAVLGDIDLDPASCAAANEVVRARQFFDKTQDGLQQDWQGTVWLNPPYSYPAILDFCEALVQRCSEGSVREAIVLVNSGTETQWGQMLLSHGSAVCFPASRVKFRRPEGKSGLPSQGQMLVYFGPRADRFKTVFLSIGAVMYGVQAGISRLEEVA